MSGLNLIKEFCASLPEKPGIYKMIGDDGELLYIGKAKNLKKRVPYYTKSDLPLRLARMVFFTRKTEYVITKSEAEAFILEANQIRLHQPRFNILLKDDKSFPYIKITTDHQYPQIMKYRGKKLKDKSLYGPFASSPDVDKTLNILKKIFKLRSCSDSYFENRKRPCLLYQIKKCSGPCVDKISDEDYKASVKYAISFLEGKNADLQRELSKKMQVLSDNMEFEKAAEVRDSIKSLSYIQLKSGEDFDGFKDADVIAVLSKNETYCVVVFFYRAGQNYGTKTYFPSHAEGADEQEVLSSFVGQFYQTRGCPKLIISNVLLADHESISEALQQLHGVKPKFNKPSFGANKKILDHVMMNAKESFERHASEVAKKSEILSEVQVLFGLKEIPTRIEVYDNSHIMGKFAVGAMVVAGINGFEKNEYRKYTIETNTSSFGGDDYQMLREVLTRRIKRIKSEPSRLPSLMIIDGGKGHMNTVAKLFKELDAHIPFVCMSKGEKRNAGGESFHMPTREAFTLSNDQSVMKYLQVLRDEVHNYAIKSHRQKRSRAISTSLVDMIPSVGSKRKKLLLNYFGSFEAIKTANIDELTKVEGISKSTAQKIYDYFRG